MNTDTCLKDLLELFPYDEKFRKLSEQETEEFANIQGSDSDLPEYLHCSICGIKIDYGNYVEKGDHIFCGDRENCPYHNNCKRFIDVWPYEKPVPEWNDMLEYIQKHAQSRSNINLGVVDPDSDRLTIFIPGWAVTISRDGSWELNSDCDGT